MTLPCAGNGAALGIRRDDNRAGLFLTPLRESLPAAHKEKLGPPSPLSRPAFGGPWDYAKLVPVIVDTSC